MDLEKLQQSKELAEKISSLRYHLGHAEGEKKEESRKSFIRPELYYGSRHYSPSNEKLHDDCLPISHEVYLHIYILNLKAKLAKLEEEFATL